ncbi:11323_t:CDS:2 [Dentiscutata erythropus]|uniref:histone deacetylase n=1 Tax=Dentiscutata erythropus TaxID=1348616 RepID=A0A9N9FYI5_9GLOM|nr:11323_t:CDS:2 [Dentiscutata erythropus]
MTKVPIVYHQGYNIAFWHLEKVHPFDTQKYKRIHRILISNGIFDLNSFYEPSPPTQLDLANLHSTQYLDSLNSSSQLQKILEVPFVAMLPNVLLKKKILDPMLLQTGGSVLAAGDFYTFKNQLALDYGWGINLGGGFHHAHHDGGGGFCVYADITLMVETILSKYPNKVSRVMIVDLDAHQGNGHERDLANNSKVHIVDAFNSHIYPQDDEAFAYTPTPIPLSTPDLRHDDKYLPLIQSNIFQSFHKFHPNFVIYNAGTDCLEGDPLGAMNLSSDAILKRDELVFRMALDHGIPIAMVLSGGYQKKNAEIIASSILNLIKKFDLVGKCKKSDKGPNPT